MKLLVCSTLLAGALGAQQAQSDRVTVPFSDAARPRTLKVSVLTGSITVTGYDGKEAIIEGRPSSGGGERRARRREPAELDGLRRLDANGTGLRVEEQDNVVTVHSSVGAPVDLVIQVPTATNLNLKSTNGAIKVERVNGEIDVNSLTGVVELRNVSGAVVAHGLNGKVLATLDQVAAGKPMSFSSLNGDIDVTLPADVKANVKMKTDNGDIYTDFDVKLDANARKPAVEESGKGARYRVKFDRGTYGTINGGGPEYSFTTFNGRIMIRKKK